MLLLIILGVVGAAALDQPVLPVLVVGALMMVGCAYYLTRIKAIIGIALGIPIFLVPRFLMTMQPSSASEFLLFMASDLALAGVAAIVIVASAAIGTYGPLFMAPLDMAGAVRMAEEADSAIKTRSLLKRLMLRK